MIPDLSITTLLQAYRQGTTTPEEVILEAWQRAAADDPTIWISRPSLEQLQQSLQALEGESPDTKPLYGIPFAIKDNIDCAGYATTAACPAWSYEAEQDAFVVGQLIAAGAIPMGKTNLDQFATGLVGVRSPYGAPDNAFNPDYISGGSSSGSGVAVAKGLCSFSLGTDTAGSGRVPASFNNLVGFKPTRGVLSCSGVVPACRTLDCVSIFALTAADASYVFNLAAVYDETDPYARRRCRLHEMKWPPRIGVPRMDQLDFFGNDDARKLFEDAAQMVVTMGWQIVEVDIQPFLDTARLLYEGPWVAERTAVVQELLAENPEAMLPVTRTIIEGGLKGSAVDAFKAQYKLATLKRSSQLVWGEVDALLMPTTGTIYTKAEVEADPIQLNSNLGRYTNFMNLLDLCGCAVPAGFLGSGLPWGVTFYAPACDDALVLDCAAHFHASLNLPIGKTSVLSDAAPLPTPQTVAKPKSPLMQIAVCGAHMEDLALHWQLREREAKFVRHALSAPCYRFFLLRAKGRIPDRPGMIRVSDGGSSIAMEIWEMPEHTVGSFLQGIGAPLGLGKVLLDDGSQVTGFICEGIVEETAEDITHFGGWRSWLATRQLATV
ncbi:allophanate hydrolase [Prosthecobacter debontii]|uniref:Allophanate hydrolase n=1 Tax=Prosthecobacter debontii TaxID=48467 RepID=A0A1T4YHW9_9BACT|nr:allophanate hydrolase [Prosthecobacter debontii]SKB01427.1 allophanate hydrolase [Prosthecobacter debontii]